MLLKVTHHCQTKQRCLIRFSRPFLLSFIIFIVLFPLVFLKKLRNQAHNQEFFRPGKFSWNQGTSINIHLQHEKKDPAGGNFPFFRLETLKNFILNEKFHLTDDHNQYISSANQDTFFQFSKKGLGRPPSPPLPLLVTPLRNSWHGYKSQELVFLSTTSLIFIFLSIYLSIYLSSYLYIPYIYHNIYI